MSVLRACVTCGKPSPGSYCAEHKPKPWETSSRRLRVRVSGSVEQARAKRILERFLYACHWCGNAGADQVDHVVPLAEGGADDDSNLAPIHAEPCHRVKTQGEAQRSRERHPRWRGTRKRDLANGTGEVARGAGQDSDVGGGSEPGPNESGRRSAPISRCLIAKRRLSAASDLADLCLRGRFRKGARVRAGAVDRVDEIALDLAKGFLALAGASIHSVEVADERGVLGVTTLVLTCHAGRRNAKYDRACDRKRTESDALPHVSS